MKLALAQLNYCVGDFSGNTKKIIEAARQAQDADLVIFSELALCGYFPFDLLKYDDFITRCESSLREIAEQCFDIPILVGTPMMCDSDNGRSLCNAAVFLYKGSRQVFVKKFLNDSPLSDERPYFDAGNDNSLLLHRGMRIAVTLGSDLDSHGADALLMENRMDELVADQPNFIINMAASVFDYTMPKRRRDVLRQTVLKYGIPLIFVNQVGAQTDLIFDGASVAFANNGRICHSLPFFEESVKMIETTSLFECCPSEDQQVIPEKMALIHDALVLGVSDYFRKMNFKDAIIGLSGGLDSALVTYFATRALGAEHVNVVLLPSQFSTGHSVDDARNLAEKLGIHYDIVPIKPMYDVFEQQLEPLFKGRSFDVTEENIQARVRAVVLMAVGNKFNKILLNTSNKSEASVGYGTLYGDLCGGLCVIGDIYKSEAFELARYINREEEIIPWHTINKAPSAELRPDQKDTDSLPDYGLLDQILYQYNECSKDVDSIIAMGFEKDIVRKVVGLVQRNEFKRHQVAPILRVSPRAFGVERLIPIVARF